MFNLYQKKLNKIFEKKNRAFGKRIGGLVQTLLHKAEIFYLLSFFKIKIYIMALYKELKGKKK